MNEKERAMFLGNVDWFNSFFKDTQAIFEKLAKRLTNEYGLKQPGFYYPKPNNVPDIPGYYMMAQGGKRFAVQVFAILNPELISDQIPFERKPSLIIYVHSRGDKALSPAEYGLRALENKNIVFKETGNSIIAGRILYEELVDFIAFQIDFDQLRTREDVLSVIDDEVVVKVGKFSKVGGVIEAMSMD